MTPNGLFEINAMIKASGKLVLLKKMLDRLKEQGHRYEIYASFQPLRRAVLT